MHKIVLGLGFGDEGKGSAVDWLCTEEPVSAVIRYNGGPQAAHNVVLPDGRHHTFSQFGSGTMRDVATHLSEYMLVNPINMVNEAEHLMDLGFPDPFMITTVSEDALLVTPYHVAANRARETARGRNRHGSCGQGVGEARAYALKYPSLAPTMRDIKYAGMFNTKLVLLQSYLESEVGDLGNVPRYEELIRQYREMLPRLEIVPSTHVRKLLDGGPCVFEGAQGVLLDETYGFHPYTTWTDTTTRNAEKLLRTRNRAGFRQFTKIGITRTYMTRHGDGPFPSEDHQLSFAEEHNGYGDWQGSWRVGDLDMSLLDYATRATGLVDEIMLTFCDVFSSVPALNIARASLYPVPLPGNREEQETLTQLAQRKSVSAGVVTNVSEIVSYIKRATSAPVTVLSYGPTSDDKERVGVPLSYARDSRHTSRS